VRIAISPSISALGVSAATESAIITSSALLHYELLISSACSPYCCDIKDFRYRHQVFGSIRIQRVLRIYKPQPPFFFELGYEDTVVLPDDSDKFTYSSARYSAYTQCRVSDMGP
jgi:hypothetical protein